MYDKLLKKPEHKLSAFVKGYHQATISIVVLDEDERTVLFKEQKQPLKRGAADFIRWKKEKNII